MRIPHPALALSESKQARLRIPSTQSPIPALTSPSHSSPSPRSPRVPRDARRDSRRGKENLLPHALVYFPLSLFDHGSGRWWMRCMCAGGRFLFALDHGSGGVRGFFAFPGRMIVQFCFVFMLVQVWNAGVASKSCTFTLLGTIMDYTVPIVLLLLPHMHKRTNIFTATGYALLLHCNAQLLRNRV